MLRMKTGLLVALVLCVGAAWAAERMTPQQKYDRCRNAAVQGPMSTHEACKHHIERANMTNQQKWDANRQQNEELMRRNLQQHEEWKRRNPQTVK